ncbi:MAG: hypothetical protein VKK59_05090 [Vampirovibrionales bacterium]|nr:hypothetical protein [Vampirovibrionales bacterium]
MNTSSSDLKPVPTLFETADDTLAPMAQKLFELFERVQAQKPERGVNALLRRAQNLSRLQNITLADALEAIYQGALQRTEARLALTQSCSGCQPNVSHRSDSKHVYPITPHPEKQPKSPP